MNNEYRNFSLLIVLLINLILCKQVNAEVLAIDEYTLFAPNGTTDTFLINKQGETVHTWKSEHRPGLSVYLLESGELLRTATPLVVPDNFTGNAGGMLEILDWDSNVVWSAQIASENFYSHHDAEVLPNGNILVLAWKQKPQSKLWR